MMRKADAVTPAESALAKVKDCGKLVELASVAEITSAVEKEVCRLIRAGTFGKVVIKMRRKTPAFRHGDIRCPSLKKHCISV